MWIILLHQLIRQVNIQFIEKSKRHSIKCSSWNEYKSTASHVIAVSCLRQSEAIEYLLTEMERNYGKIIFLGSAFVSHKENNSLVIDIEFWLIDDVASKVRAKTELAALEKAHRSVSDYRACLAKQSNSVKGKEKTLIRERRMFSERKDLVERHLNDVVNMHDQYGRLDSPTSAADNYRSELERKSVALWKRESDLKYERRMIDSRTEIVQRQLNELNQFRLDLQIKKS